MNLEDFQTLQRQHDNRQHPDNSIADFEVMEFGCFGTNKTLVADGWELTVKKISYNTIEIVPDRLDTIMDEPCRIEASFDLTFEKIIDAANTGEFELCELLDRIEATGARALQD